MYIYYIWIGYPTLAGSVRCHSKTYRQQNIICYHLGLTHLKEVFIQCDYYFFLLICYMFWVLSSEDESAERAAWDKRQLTWEHTEVMCLVALIDRWSQNTSCVGGEQARHCTPGHLKSEHRAFVNNTFWGPRQQPSIFITQYEWYCTCLLTERMTKESFFFFF